LRNFLRIGFQIDQLELQARGLADQALERIGILNTGNRNEDSALALVDDRDFLSPAGGRRRAPPSSSS
jgi:hypothetical protein